jgi:hypothetical protein
VLTEFSQIRVVGYDTCRLRQEKCGRRVPLPLVENDTLLGCSYNRPAIANRKHVLVQVGFDDHLGFLPAAQMDNWHHTLNLAAV